MAWLDTDRELRRVQELYVNGSIHSLANAADRYLARIAELQDERDELLSEIDEMNPAHRPIRFGK